MLQYIREAVLEGDQERTRELVESALAEGIESSSLLNEALIPAMDVVGQEYETGIRFLPEMLISAEAMKEAMKILRPILAEAGVAARGRVVLGTVQGDLHDIGKDLVCMMLEGAGFEVIDLGTEVGLEQFVESVREYHPDIVAMSALLTTTMIYMPGVVEALERAGLREAVKIVVGGAPVTQEYADAIGADGYAADAPGAVALVRRLLAKV